MIEFVRAGTTYKLTLRVRGLTISFSLETYIYYSADRPVDGAKLHKKM